MSFQEHEPNSDFYNKIVKFVETAEAAFYYIDENGKPAFDSQKVLNATARQLSTYAYEPSASHYLPKMPPTTEANFLENIHKSFEMLHARGSDYEPTFRVLFIKEVKQMADRIRTRKAYSLLEALSRKTNEIISDENLSNVSGIYRETYLTLYQLVCGGERFLINTKGHPIWKKVKLKEQTDTETFRQWSEIKAHIPLKLHELDEETSVTIPDYFINHENISKIRAPQSNQIIEKSLETAYYEKQYYIPPKGAEVFLRNGQDLQSYVLLERNGVVWSKAITPNGEFLFRLDLDEGKIEDTKNFIVTNEEIPVIENMGKILAEVYRDMSISIIKPVKAKSKGKSSPLKPLKGPEQFHWTYIPRERRIPRPQKTSEEQHRSPRPHRVRPFKRIGNMTEEHKRKIQIYEQQTGLRILDNLPEGYTIVRDFIRPKDSIEQIAGLPKFIKRRIEAELRRPIIAQNQSFQ